MPIETHVKSSGSWRKAARVAVRAGEVWRDCREVYVRSGGVWRKTYTPWFSMTAGAGIDGGGGAYSGFMGVTDTGYPLFGSVNPTSLVFLNANLVMCYATRDDQGIFNSFTLTLGSHFLAQSVFTTMTIVGTGVNVSLSSASAFFSTSTTPSSRAFWSWTTPDIQFTNGSVYAIEFII